MQDGYHRYARLAEFGQVAEQRPAVGETLHGVVEQVPSGAFHQVHERQLLLQGDHLRPGDAVAAGSGQGAGLYAAVVHHHNAAHTADKTDAGDDRAARYGFLRIGVVQQVAGDIAYGQEGHAGVQQPRQALPWGELAAGIEARPALLRDHGAAGVEALQVLDVRQHLLAIFAERLGVRVDFRVEHGHDSFSAMAVGTGMGQDSSNWA